jgi:hypothetical protein
VGAWRRWSKARSPWSGENGDIHCGLGIMGHVNITMYRYLGDVFAVQFKNAPVAVSGVRTSLNWPPSSSPSRSPAGQRKVTILLLVKVKAG